MAQILALRLPVGHHDSQAIVDVLYNPLLTGTPIFEAVGGVLPLRGSPFQIIGSGYIGPIETVLGNTLGWTHWSPLQTGSRSVGPMGGATLPSWTRRYSFQNAWSSSVGFMGAGFDN